jgi:uncharacterized protein
LAFYRAQSALPLAFLFLAIAAGVVLFRFVGLEPRVDPNFFFASDDPQLQDSRRIEEMFRAYDLVVLSVEGDIHSPSYLEQIAGLTQEISRQLPATSIFSLSAGPFSLGDALKSPLWSRLLIAEGEKSSNLLLFFERQDSYSGPMATLEEIQHSLGGPGFRIAISGVPWVSFHIQRSVLEEVGTFSLVALGLAAFWMMVIFRSPAILAGSLVSCATACFFTFLLLDLLGVETGVLTANLWSIVFVLTLSHIVFITGNWRALRGKEAVERATRQTRMASFWAMLTTLLGFLALLTTPAKPIRDFGLSGGLGAVLAILAAYLIFPAFLRLAPSPATPGRPAAFLLRNHAWSWLLVLLLAGMSVLGLPRISTDRNLFSYFEEGGHIRRDLTFLDRGGGVSPMDLVVRDSDSIPFASEAGYRKLWGLQLALEGDPAVGIVFSPPVLMAELVVSPMAPFLEWEQILQLFESPLFGEIGFSFLSRDRTHARFLLRMRESALTEPRGEVVARLEAMAREQGFEPVLSGGLFKLQGDLAELVGRSLIQGLFWLLGLFTLIAFLVSRSLLITLVMMTALGSVPLILLGFVGFARIPLDIISTPAVNIALALGVDGMIHLASRARAEGGGSLSWERALHRLWHPILASALVVSSGFGIFALSHFPPTRQLGLVVALGTVLATFVTLLFLPSLSRALEEKTMQPSEKANAA